MEVDLIIRMGFLIRDPHNHIVDHHKKQFIEHTHKKWFTVFRDQGLSKDDFDRMVKTQSSLLLFNNFLSTSTKEQISLNFACQPIATSDLVGMVFVMTIRPSILSTPLANVSDVSYFKEEEEEILFSINSIIRMDPMKQIDENNRRWQVDLTLTSDNDPDLNALTERMREETYPEKEGWDHLGNLLIKLEQFNNAEEVYDILLHRTRTDAKKALMNHMLGMVKDD
ncbi:unnamed protein product [Rotaria sp. Silwood1]|nr:unnamed protein product [Rotaria sp. Silwood1]CAF3549218.1 unnamed protein product [Rotaria sp. Silwood1]CAF4571728.1 unnamed protein product [Rotaria sp. Silwood1]CAF5112101.1 unnamed protein product [Rotaria sp. Silwood1]